MFDSISRSWEFAKMSYRLLGKHPKLIVFPVISSIAGVLVMASFIVPLWEMGMLKEWMAFMDEETATQGDPAMYVTAFLFYFCTYFTMIFFNTALVACVMRLVHGMEASVSFGLSFAMKRLPQIFGWALVSAVIGVILKSIENSNKRVGKIVAALLGSAWTVMTYFVVPVIVLNDGMGPVAAFKESVKTIKKTWGTALVGNFSLGLISFVVLLPLYLLAIGALFWGFSSAATGSPQPIFIGIGIAVLLVLISVSITTTADAIFKTFLFTYATKMPLPDDVDTSQFLHAFKQK